MEQEMRQSARQNRSRRLPRLAAWVMAMACLLLAVSPVLAKPGSVPGTNGAYDATVRGDFRGRGKVIVTPKQININIHVVDQATGATVQLKAVGLDLEDGRFTGAGTLGGEAVAISGRVEAGDGNVVVESRILCSFRTTSGACGRVVAEKKTGP